MYTPKTNLKKSSRKRNTSKKVSSNKETDDEDLEIVYGESSDDDEMLNMIRSVSDIVHNRKRPKNTLKEFEELNETLKKKLKLRLKKNKEVICEQKSEECEPESEEDVYTPNGVDAYMLFGSPLKEPVETEDEPEHEESDNQWNIQIKKIPDIEESVLVDDIEEVSELSELGSFGQKDLALDLSIPVPANESHLGNALLDRHLISESIQIIDQLAPSETSSGFVYEVKEIEGRVSKHTLIKEELAERKVQLPSFQSVSQSRPSVVYSLQVPSDYNNYVEEVQQEIVTESCNKETQEESLHSDLFTRETDECILGD